MTSESDPRSRRLEQIIAQYLHAVEAGTPLDSTGLIAEHPDLADELRAFFAEHDRIRRRSRSREESRPQPDSQAIDDATIPPTDAASARAGPGTADSGILEGGTRIRYFGDYELLEEIARGGMGVVYKARQVSLDRIVALKMILAGQLAGDEEIARFRSEAQAAAILDHPGIVPIYEIGEHAGHHFFSMGYVDGESLADTIEGGALEPRRAAEILAKVADAVGYAHRCGIVHRDIKPSNVLMDREQPRVTDFGVARRVDAGSELTRTGQILGTPSYMPPEQAAGDLDGVGPRVDVYSLGALFYAMLVGKAPFQAASPMETLLKVLDSDTVPPRAVDKKIPVALDTITRKCMERSPSLRYGSAFELKEDLERYLSGANSRNALQQTSAVREVV